MSEMVTSWFTFGFDHVHHIGEQRFDQNVIVKVTAPAPRAVMVGQFGARWAFEYRDPAEVEALIKRWKYKEVELGA